MKLKRKLFFFIIFILPLVITVLIGYNYVNNIKNDVFKFNKISYTIEKEFIKSFPIYDDYVSEEVEKKLRTYLFKDHIKIAKEKVAVPIKSVDDIGLFVKSGKLVSIDDELNKKYFFYGVKKEYRFLSPAAFKGLNQITDRFNKKIKDKKISAVVKIALSSALRPEKYQKKLTSKNGNAVIKSTHSYGVSFDLFWDDFYLVMPEIGTNRVSKEILSKLRVRTGFILGDSLRRQLRTVLSETLLELQDEGVLYATLERKQRCYHITIIN